MYFQYQDKKIYYHMVGEGESLLFLHGDTASSRMFEFIIPLYQNDFQVICIDFLGCGKSDRLDVFPDELWLDQAQQVIVLLEHIKKPRVHLIGTSGGAWVAMNVALKRPDLVGKVIADSFDGRYLHDGFIDELIAERTFACQDELASQFYEWCQGDDWQQVVEANTKSLLHLAKYHLPLFYKELSDFKNPLLLTGSLNDEMLRKDLKKEYEEICKEIGHGEIYLFCDGQHPALLSQAKDISDVIRKFILKKYD